MLSQVLELKEIKRRLSEIDRKLDAVLTMNSRIRSQTLSSLPTHLKKTATAIADLGEATAEQVAKETGRVRAAESDYLNQLASRGLVKKERRGKEVYFRVFALYRICYQCGARVLISLDQCAMCGATFK
jgi:hypothetical protein